MSALQPLKERNFRLLWAGQAISAIGDSLVTIALAFATLSVAAIMALPSFFIILVPGVRSVRRTPEGLIVAGA
jgi:hypothetical protein